MCYFATEWINKERGKDKELDWRELTLNNRNKCQDTVVSKKKKSASPIENVGNKRQ